MTLQPDEAYCPGCGEPIKRAAVWCPNCGMSTEESGDSDPSAMAYCQSCGERVHREADLCPHCGVRQRDSGAASTDAAGEGDSGRVAQWVVGAILLVSGLGVLTDPGGSVVASLLVGGALVAAGLAVVPGAPGRIERRHPPTAFGWTPTVRERPVSNPDATCSNCYGEIDAGVRRSYGKDFAVAGVVVSERTDGENHYCDACQRVERSVETAMAVEA